MSRCVNLIMILGVAPLAAFAGAGYDAILHEPLFRTLSLQSQTAEVAPWGVQHAVSGQYADTKVSYITIGVFSDPAAAGRAATVLAVPIAAPAHVGELQPAATFGQERWLWFSNPARSSGTFVLRRENVLISMHWQGSTAGAVAAMDQIDAALLGNRAVAPYALKTDAWSLSVRDIPARAKRNEKVVLRTQTMHLGDLVGTALYDGELKFLGKSHNEQIEFEVYDQKLQGMYLVAADARNRIATQSINLTVQDK